MSTPQTLTQTLPPHQHLGQQRYLPSPQDRYLPPPRPSSNLSNGYHHNIPTRPSSNLSNRQLPPPPPRPESGMSNPHYSQHAHSQSRGGEYSSYAGGFSQPQHHQQEELRRMDSRSNYQQQQRQLPPLPQQPPQSASASRASAAGAADIASAHSNRSVHSDSMERGRKRRQKSPVDWVKYFGGKPPTEIIEIHDDDSPAPTATVQRVNPPTGNVSGTSTQHADKRRRTNGNTGEVPTYSTTNTPYSYSNGTSTESLQTTTAPTSLGSTASSSSRIDTAQTGQKRKRSTRTTDAERKKQELERSGPKGYLAEYGQYVPPKQIKKMKDVTVPQIHDVSIQQDWK